MISMERTVRTTAPAREVFDYLSDFTNAEQWDPNADRVVRNSGHGGVGSTYVVTSKFAGRTTELEYRLVDLEPGRLIRLRGEKKSVTAIDTITVTRGDSTAGYPAAGDADTRVTYAVEFDFHGVLGWFEPVLRIAVRRLLNDGAVGLAAALAKLT